MPYRFTFRSDDGVVTFSCPLTCRRCTATRVNGGQCSRNTCIGVRLCWQHLLSSRFLRIRDSNLQGKGLFAQDARRPANAVIFHQGQTIVNYDGQVISNAQLDTRYGDYTAPYGLSSGNRNEDGACHRGIGTLANGAPAPADVNAIYLPGPGGRLRLVATRDIRNNTEILCDYGDDYDFDDPTEHVTKYARH